MFSTVLKKGGFEIPVSNVLCENATTMFIKQSWKKFWINSMLWLGSDDKNSVVLIPIYQNKLNDLDKLTMQ